MAYEHLRVAIADGVAELTLDRPASGTPSPGRWRRRSRAPIASATRATTCAPSS